MFVGKKDQISWSRDLSTHDMKYHQATCSKSHRCDSPFIILYHCHLKPHLTKLKTLTTGSYMGGNVHTTGRNGNYNVHHSTTTLGGKLLLIGSLKRQNWPMPCPPLLQLSALIWCEYTSKSVMHENMPLLNPITHNHVCICTSVYPLSISLCLY